MTVYWMKGGELINMKGQDQGTASCIRDGWIIKNEFSFTLKLPHKKDLTISVRSSWLWIYSLDRSWERNCLADVFDAAQPGSDTLGAHAEARVGNRPIFA